MRWNVFKTAGKVFFSYAFFASFCSTALCLETYLVLHQPIDGFLLGFVFLATLSSYNFHFFLANYFLSTGRQSGSLTPALRFHLFLFALGCFAGLVVLYFHPIRLDLLISGILMTLVYSMPVAFFSNNERLNKWGYVKTILLAVVWSFVTIFFPLDTAHVADTSTVFFLFFQRLLFLFILCVIFEKKDQLTDSETGIHTIATEMSSKQLDRMVLVVFVSWFLVNHLGMFVGLSNQFLLTRHILLASVFVVYKLSLQIKNAWFYYLIADGMMILSCLLVILMAK